MQKEEAETLLIQRLLILRIQLSCNIRVDGVRFCQVEDRLIALLGEELLHERAGGSFRLEGRGFQQRTALEIFIIRPRFRQRQRRCRILPAQRADDCQSVLS